MGTLKNGTVFFNQQFGGGQASLEALEEQADNFWNEYPDISKLSPSARLWPIRGAIDRVRRGDQIETPSAAAQVAIAAGKGFLTGCKATANAAASTAVSTLTLGYIDNVEIVEVTQEDIQYGYYTAYGFSRLGMEVGVGVLTGTGATKLAQGSTQLARGGSYLLRGWDATQNVVHGARGVADMARNGVTVQNSLQVLGAGLATAGDFTGALGKVKKPRNVVSFAPQR